MVFWMTTITHGPLCVIVNACKSITYNIKLKDHVYDQHHCQSFMNYGNIKTTQHAVKQCQSLQSVEAGHCTVYWRRRLLQYESWDKKKIKPLSYKHSQKTPHLWGLFLFCNTLWLWTYCVWNCEHDTTPGIILHWSCKLINTSPLLSSLPAGLF